MSSLTDQRWCPTSVQVTVLQARGLRAKGKSGTNDAYAVMAVGKDKYQTSVAEKSVAPMWKEEATFDLPQPPHGGGGDAERSALRVHVLHRALVGPDKLLGKAVIGLQRLSEDKTRNKTEWFKLLDKTGKADKDRGEVLVDIQFMRNNMTASMFDLSAAGKSRSRLGKFKDKVHGKKKESDAVSAVEPPFAQVLTDSEEEGNGAVASHKDEKKKKHKLKLFSTKSNLQKSMSQSMTVLPGKNSSLSGSQSSGLNVDSSEGKKKFSFMIHKRPGSKDSSSEHQKHGAAEQSNLCINASHTYAEEPRHRTSNVGSSFSLASSGHGSMEDSPPAVDSPRGVRQYSPWTEEEEETVDGGNVKEDEGKLKRDEEERIRMEERRRKEEKEERVRRQEAERLAEEKRRQARQILEEEEKVKKEEEERIQEEMRRQEGERRRIEEEKVKKEKEERIRWEEEERIQEEMKRQEEERRKTEEERIRKEEEKRIQEERRRKDERKFEEEKVKKEKEEKIRREEEERIQEEMRRQERRKTEEEKVKKEKEEKIRREEEERIQEERRKTEEEKIRREEEERIQEEMRRQERRKTEEEKVKEEKIRREEEERIQEERRKTEEEKIRREEEERIQDEMRRQERRKTEEEKVKKEKEETIRREEEERIQEEMRRQEGERRRIEEEKVKKEKEETIRREEEERIQEEMRRQEEERKLSERWRLEEEERREEERVQEEMKKQEEEEMLRRQECEVKRRLEEQEKRERDKVERKKKEEEEEKRKRIEAVEKLREVERIRLEEKRRRNEEERRLIEEKRILEEKEQMRIEEKEKMQREEEERIREEERKQKEVRARKEKEEYETLVEEKISQKEQERRIEEREEEQEMIVMEEQRKYEEEEENKREEEAEEEAKKLGNRKPTGNVEEEKGMESKKKFNVSEIKSEGSAETTSPNPIDESFSNDPFEENPNSPAGPHSNSAKEPRVQQRSPSAVSSLGREAVSADDKDLSGTQREKRPAPQPPGRDQAQRRSQRERDRSTLHLAQSDNRSKGKDVRTASVSPQRAVHMIAPLGTSPTLAKNTESLMQSSSAKGAINIAEPSKRPAPSRPLSVEDEPTSGPETASSSDGEIPSDYSSGVKREPTVHGLNPFEDDEDKNELTAEDHTGAGSMQWPPAVSKAAAAADAVAQAKIKSSKKAHAPPLPAKTAATSSSPVSRSTEGGHDRGDRGAAVTDCNVTQPRDPEEVPETQVQESQAAMVPSAGEKTGGKKEGPPTASRRLQPVKPLNPLRQQPVSVIQEEIDKKSTGYFNQVWEQTRVNGTGLKGPYSQLTREELISLVLKQENQLSQKDKRISELEQYIDNLLVCVIEEKPSILMSINSLK